jgi:hypothetical protein
MSLDDKVVMIVHGVRWRIMIRITKLNSGELLINFSCWLVYWE